MLSICTTTLSSLLKLQRNFEYAASMLHSNLEIAGGQLFFKSALIFSILLPWKVATCQMDLNKMSTSELEHDQCIRAQANAIEDAAPSIVD